MTLNPKQKMALYALWKNSLESKRMTFEEFNTTVYPMPFEPTVAMVPFCGMIVGIEPDGYTHS